MRLLTIDGNNLVHRVFHIANTLPYSSENFHIYMFLNSIKSYVNMYQPDKVFCVWDEKIDKIANKRIDILPEYKSTRNKEKNNAVHQKNDIIKEFLLLMGIPSILPREYEADDVIAIINKNIAHSKHIIVTVDRDLCQLINNTTVVYDAIRKIEININNFSEHLKCPINQFLCVKAISGDKSDNIPGIKGFGKKKIKKYLNQEIQLTSEQQEILDRNMQIMSLITDGDEETYVLDQLNKPPSSPNWDLFKSMVIKYKFKSIINNHDDWYQLFFHKSRLVELLA